MDSSIIFQKKTIKSFKNPRQLVITSKLLHSSKYIVAQNEKD